jgi:hypothetical protein
MGPSDETVHRHIGKKDIQQIAETNYVEVADVLILEWLGWL